MKRESTVWNQRVEVLPVASSLRDSERPAKAQSIPSESFRIRMSTKNFCLDVRTSVEVASDGGSGSHCMKARVEMLGGDVAGWLGRSREAIMVCMFLEMCVPNDL